MSNDTFSNAKINSYDNSVSSLSFRYFNNLGVIDVNPINPEFIGVTPKKGDKVYNYEAKMSLYIVPQLAHSALKAIAQLRKLIETGVESDDGKPVAIRSFTVAQSGNSITLYAPGQITVKANKKVIDTSENFVLSIKNKKDEIANHILQNDAVEFMTADKSVLEDTVFTGLDMLELFLEQVVQLNIYGNVHAASVANNEGRSGSTGGGSKSGNSYFNNSLDDDEDEEDVVDEVPASKKSASKKKLAAVMEDEFDEDE